MNKKCLYIYVSTSWDLCAVPHPWCWYKYNYVLHSSHWTPARSSWQSWRRWPRPPWWRPSRSPEAGWRRPCCWLTSVGRTEVRSRGWPRRGSGLVTETGEPCDVLLWMTSTLTTMSMLVTTLRMMMMKMWPPHSSPCPMMISCSLVRVCSAPCHSLVIFFCICRSECHIRCRNCNIMQTNRK